MVLEIYSDVGEPRRTTVIVVPSAACQTKQHSPLFTVCMDIDAATLVSSYRPRDLRSWTESRAGLCQVPAITTRPRISGP